MKTNHVLRFAILAALSSGSAMAQVVFDGTLPGTTAGSLGAVAGTYSINQDRGFVNGRNLFHSFQFFSIDIGETAVFQSTNAIRNIISRVTGNMPTTIDGTLSASNPNITSFWLINPAGIMVGETAVLDIPGAVALGAADTIQFSNGESWSALNSGFSDATTLSVNPMDFGFLGSTAGGLTIRGQNFASTGADTITDRFGEQRSWLLSGGPGVTIESATDLLLSEAKVESIRITGNPALGTIDILSNADVNIDSSLINSVAAGADAAGNIFITGKNITTDGSRISSTASGSGDSGFIQVAGRNINLIRSSFQTSATENGSAGSIALGTGIANGAIDDIELNGTSMSLDGTNIQSSTTGSGNAGEILLQASSIALDGGVLESSTTGEGSASSILIGSGIHSSVQAGSRITLNETNIQTITIGDKPAGAKFVFTGGISLRAESIELNGGSLKNRTTDDRIGEGIGVGSRGPDSSITLDGTKIQTIATGNKVPGGAGDIALIAHSVALNGGIIESVITLGSAGLIHVGQGDTNHPDEQAGSSITLEGTKIRSNAITALQADSIVLNKSILASSGGGQVYVGSSRPDTSITLNGTTIQVSSSGAGEGGAITLKASSVALNESILESTTTGDGRAGWILIGTDSIDPDGDSQAQPGSSITIVDSLITTTTSGPGNAGFIRLDSEDLHLSGSAITSASLSGIGNGGTIVLNIGPFGGLRMEDDSQIVTRALSASGGDIVINASGSLITLRDATIEASAGAGGQGGDITISDAGQTILQGSGILARAENGDGGSIEINLSPGEVFVQDSESLVSADSGSGINGEVTIDSPNTDLNSALQPQDVDISRPATLASDVCTRTTTNSRSTFVRAGRGGVAERPDGYLTITTADASEDAKRGSIVVASLGSGCL